MSFRTSGGNAAAPQAWYARRCSNACSSLTSRDCRLAMLDLRSLMSPLESLSLESVCIPDESGIVTARTGDATGEETRASNSEHCFMSS